MENGISSILYFNMIGCWIGETLGSTYVTFFPCHMFCNCDSSIVNRAPIKTFPARIQNKLLLKPKNLYLSLGLNMFRNTLPGCSTHVPLIHGHTKESFFLRLYLKFLMRHNHRELYFIILNTLLENLKQFLMYLPKYTHQFNPNAQILSMAHIVVWKFL